MADRIDGIRALIAADGYGDGGISISTARDLLALYDAERERAERAEAFVRDIAARIDRDGGHRQEGETIAETCDRIDTVLAWMLGTDDAETIATLVSAKARAEDLASARGEQFARMHADRDAWRDRAEKAEAEVERLRAAMPSESECIALGAALGVASCHAGLHGDISMVEKWLARVEAARGGGR